MSFEYLIITLSSMVIGWYARALYERRGIIVLILRNALTGKLVGDADIDTLTRFEEYRKRR